MIPPIFLYAGIIALVYAFIRFFLLKRGFGGFIGRLLGGGEHGGDVVVGLVFDPVENTCFRVFLRRFHENNYVAFKGSKPITVSFPSDAKPMIYEENGRKYTGYLIMGKGFIYMPVDPEVLYATYMIHESDLMRETPKETGEFLSELFNMGESKMGVVHLSPRLKIGFTFRPLDILVKTLDTMFLRLLDVLENYISNVAHSRSFAEFVSSLTEYRMVETQAKVSKAVMIFIILLGVGMLLWFLKG